MNYFTHLECGKCGERLDPDRLWNLCPKCAKPLLARYDLETAKGNIARDAGQSRADNLWRFHEFMPVRDASYRITLGEGMTPLFRANRLGESLGFDNLYIKDESCNPTTSFKARGMAAAVSRAWELGVTALSVPSAGNAAGAMAAYAAAAGLPAYVYMPTDVPEPFVAECRALGAQIELIDGLITDCGRVAVEAAKKHNRFDLSTLKEPYRLEGKKTMGYELAEQFGWKLPDVVIYPTGGGTGLVGMWKAFEEMEQLGWIGRHRPRMVTVQATGCAPIVRAFEAGAEAADLWEGAKTVADGLRVPAAVGDFLMLESLRDSGGTAIAVPDDEMVADAVLLGKKEGIFAAPEGGATVSAFRRLRERGWIADGERTVLFVTGSGHKYAHLFT
jgi:threonine synthase